ncbi:MAG: hypothetical protein GY757_22775 [bacterium]|nr:hypothetical protein [bacterium]
MRSNSGKIRLSTLLIMAVIGYGGFIAVKIASAKLMQSQIQNEVIDTFGLMRGADFNEDAAIEAIIKILKKNDIIFEDEYEDTVSVEIDNKGGKIYFRFKYEVEVDFLFFQQRSVVEVDDLMGSYS